VADPKFDPVAHAQNAQQLTALATQARAALRADIVERTSRLGRQRDEAAREAYGAEQEAAAANQQAKRELAAAEKFDKEAAALERKAAVLERNAQNSATAEGEAADLREQAADQRAFADAARQRSHDAEQAHDRVELDAATKHRLVETVEQQLAGEPARRAQIEQAVDNLEWHAQQATGSADLARLAADLEAQAAAADARGDTVVAAAARQTAAEYRSGIETTANVRGFLQPDPQALRLINVTLAAGALDVPGFPGIPAATPSSAPTSQLDETSEPGSEELPAGVVADAATDDPTNEADTTDTTDTTDTGVTTDDSSDVGDLTPAAAADRSTEVSVVAESDAVLAQFFDTEASAVDAMDAVPGAVDPLDPSTPGLASLDAIDEAAPYFAADVAAEAADSGFAFDDPAGFSDA
jgi:hypothetical protein